MTIYRPFRCAEAAEEILGTLCEREGKLVAIEEITTFHWSETDPTLSDKEREKILYNLLNDARNAAKHANDPKETYFDVARVYGKALAPSDV